MINFDDPQELNDDMLDELAGSLVRKEGLPSFHPAEEELYLYESGAAGDELAEWIEGHIRECPRCGVIYAQSCAAAELLERHHVMPAGILPSMSRIIDLM